MKLDKLTKAPIETILIDKIVVKERRRQRMGKLQGLMRSIARQGLIHPIIIRNGNELAAGARRLESCKRLNWKTIPARRIERMTNEEMRAIELDENREREALTGYDSAKARLAEIKQIEAKQQAEEKELSRHGVSKNAKRGRPKKNTASRKTIAAEFGASSKTIERMAQQIEIAERFPFLQQQDWGRMQTLRVSKLMESFSSDEQTAVAALLDQPYIPPAKSLEILQNLCEMSKEKRTQIFEQARSDDQYERTKALEAAALLPPSPDPGFLRLHDICKELRRAIEVCRNESFKVKMQAVAEGLERLFDEFEQHVDQERERFLAPVVQTPEPV